jgi:hypothetical protein
LANTSAPSATRTISNARTVGISSGPVPCWARPERGPRHDRPPPQRDVEPPTTIRLRAGNRHPSVIEHRGAVPTVRRVPIEPPDRRSARRPGLHQ